MKTNPFSRERFVRWGDCDPAGIIYAPKVYEYAIDTLEEFYKEVIGYSWMDLKDKSVVGTPILRLEIEYMRPLVPDQKIVVEINLKEVGIKTVTFEMNGVDHSEDQFFHVEVTMCFISQADFKPSDIPDKIRKRLLNYGF